MPRFLALDGDTSRIQLLSASLKGDTVRLEKSLVWDEDQPISKANASAVGERLRAKLKEAGIAPAPLLVCLGRDRVIVKEIKIPPVPLHEEPAIVRFQALKELTESGDDSVLDYVPVHSAAGERRVQVMAVKKDLIVAYKKLAEAAGLKLVNVAPRPFAVLAGLKRAIATGQVPPVGPTNAAVAVLVRGDKWGEFLVVHNNELTIARSLAGPALTNDGILLGEIRRNLAVHANQHPDSPVRALYLAEPDTPGGLRERLQDSLAIPVHAYEPAVGVPVPDGPPGGLAGPAGMFAIRAAGESPVNFVQPRQPKPPTDSFKRILALTAVAALLFLVGLFAFATIRISAKKKAIAAVQKRVNENQQVIRTRESDSKGIKALDEWTANDINWLDEIYDATARMDRNSKNIRITSLAANIQEDRTGKNKNAGAMTIKGVTKKDPVPVDSFINAFVHDPGYTVGPKTTKDNTVVDPQTFPTEFTTRIDLQRRPPEKYTRTFKADVPPKRQRGRPVVVPGGMPDFELDGGIVP
jgi:Tfp pilus assembly PilM family ATPase